MGTGEILTFDNLVLDFVSGDDEFVFDGFVGIAVGNVSGTEEILVEDSAGTDLAVVSVANGGTGNGSDVGNTLAFSSPATSIILKNNNGGTTMAEQQWR